MKAYLARLNAEQGNAREIVGFFMARSIPQLYDLIDECCDVDRVEVMEIGPGGLFWPISVDFVVPHPEELHEEPPDLPAGANLCDLWVGAFFNENADKWHQLEFAD